MNEVDFRNWLVKNDVNKKIALMYASDYGYAASKECTSNLYDYDGSASCRARNNWLDKSVIWLLSQDSASVQTLPPMLSVWIRVAMSLAASTSTTASLPCAQS